MTPRRDLEAELNLDLVFVVGTAGSGKSHLVSAFSAWLIGQRENVCTVNLDPGALALPYTPDINVRDYIRVEDLMEQHTIGPNGALVLASDMIADQIEEIREELDTIDPDLALVDTPGQLELFAFRQSGKVIAESLPGEEKTSLYLFDSVFCRRPLNYVVSVFLSAAVSNMFILPQIHVLTKVDLLKEADIQRALDWGSDPETLEEAIEKQLTESNRVMSQGMLQAISDIGVEISLIPFSTRTNQGFTDLYAELCRTMNEGERFTP